MKKVSGVILSVLVFVVVCELAARAFLWMAPIETDVGTPRRGLTADAVGDWVPAQTAIWENDRLEFPFFVHINGSGFRNIDELDDAAHRVLVLGDSQTFGLFVGSHDIWTNVAEKNLRAQLDMNLQLLNNGIPGTTITDHLAYLQEKGEELAPDMVVLAVSSNDIVDMRREDMSIRSLRSEWMESNDNVALRSVRWFLRHHSGLYVAARAVKEKLIASRHKSEAQALGLDAKLGAPTENAEPDTSMIENARRYRDVMSKAIARVRTLGAEPVIFMLLAPWDRDTDLLGKTLSEIASSHNVPLLSTLDTLRDVRRDAATWHRDPEIDPDYIGDGHFNRYGNLLIGEFLAESLAPLIAAQTAK